MNGHEASSSPPVPTTTDQLESKENLSEQRLEWRIERIAWGGMGVVLLAALLGLLGPGPLSYRDESSPDGTLGLEYSQAEHYEAPAEWCVRVHRPNSQASTVRLVVSRSFTDRTTVQSIVPQPSEIHSEGEEVVYTFRMNDLPEGGKILYRYEHNRFGPVEARVGLEGAEPLKVWQFVFP